jgi:CRISPR-associated protein Csm3
MENKIKFVGKHIIKGIIKLETGLHIGGTNEGFQIGGIDNIVIKDPITNMPIIPGSSLKGKIRSLLELKYANLEINEKNNSYYSVVKGDKKSEFILKLFGQTKDWKSDEALGPVRLIFRDCKLNEESKKELEKYLGEGIYTEVKAENSIDRLTSAANPRFIERVVAGSEFDFEIVMDNYTEKDYIDLKYLFEGLLLLEDSYLGGGGSRGSGKVRIFIEKISKRSLKYYESGKSKVESNSENNLIPIKEFIKDWNEWVEKLKIVD